jgi:hypothetical protein
MGTYALLCLSAFFCTHLTHARKIQSKIITLESFLFIDKFAFDQSPLQLLNPNPVDDDSTNDEKGGSIHMSAVFPSNVLFSVLI